MRKIGLARFIENEFVWKCHTCYDNIQMSFHTHREWENFALRFNIQTISISLPNIARSDPVAHALRLGTFGSC